METTCGGSSMSENETRTDGGAAFPRPFSEDTYLEDTDYEAQEGMSLSDYFAAKAMQIQMANKKEMNFWASEDSIEEMWEFCARNAYDMADAMIKARER